MTFVCLFLHLVDELHSMRGRGGNAGLRFDVADHVQAETLHEVRPRAVIGHDLGAFVGSHRGVPAAFSRRQTLVEIGIALIEVGLVPRRKLAQLVLDRLRDAAAVARVEPVMRVALRVHVAHRTGDLARGNLQNPNVGRRIEISVCARLDLRVAAAVDERRQPSDFQFATDHDEEIGAADFEDKARFRIDEMRILISLGEADDRDVVAADFARQRGKVFGCSNDAHRCRGRPCCRHERRGEQDEANERLHNRYSFLFRTDARRARQSRS